MDEGRYEEALGPAERAAEFSSAHLGGDHPSTLIAVNNLALLYDDLGRYAEAEPLYVQVRAVRERVLGAEHPDTLGSLTNLAAFLVKQGLYVLAEPGCQRALEAN